jgi:hypothetical protein
MLRTLIRALVTTTLATGAAYLALTHFAKDASRLPRPTRGEGASDSKEVDADALPGDLRDRLLTELESHV